MCGIAGIIDLASESIDAQAIERLTEALRHRGPDDGGVHVGPHVGLGSRRLSVIDLSPRGHMPMANDDGTLWITYNGEVYNFRELRTELEGRGHRFHSTTDTEVVLRSYEEWGDACVEKLAGMFALAIWDAPRRRLFAARDRLGVKPLYLTRSGGRLIFASEVHPLYAHLRPTAERVDRLALDHYLAFGFVPTGGSFIRGIEKLPPGHALVFDEEGFRSWRYWHLSYRPSLDISFEDAALEVDRTLAMAVERRLVADVPIGSFLSGGIDSGLVTAYAARATTGKLRTFSVGFEGNPPESDERDLARLVAERYDTDHTELLVSPGSSDLLPRILWHYGEPFADASAFAVYEISRISRQHITVALSGDGGDESFAGYPKVRTAYLAQRYREWVPSALRRLVRGAVELPLPLPQRERAGRWLEWYVDRCVADQLDMSHFWTRDLRRQLYAPGLGFDPNRHQGNALVHEMMAGTEDLTDAEQHLWADMYWNLPGDYLAKVDIASNMASLEIRSPFLDHELCELAARLPIDVKAPRGYQKALLRHIAGWHLPEQIVHAPKRGFAPPVTRWLRGDWLPMVREVVGRRLAERPAMFDGDLIRRFIEEHASGKRDHTTRLYALLCLEVWWELFIDGSLAPGDPL